MSILIVEDNVEIQLNIADYLSMKGYSVDFASDAFTALHLLSTNSYALVLLDVMIPGLDGFELLTKIRTDCQLSIPVIMLTARGEVADRLRGFEAGADDYLVKPFSLAELHARVKAVLKRGGNVVDDTITVGELFLNRNTFKVSRAGIDISLNKIGFRILEQLMKNSPSVVSREALMQAVWGDEHPDSDSLRSHLHLLRKEVDKPFGRPLIKTIRGVGFCINEE
ncbi:DNA-binding response OmpR family regulator [Sinobacterium caligoides]|uniref:DNA-binding response OmpR family regulator n=1 Tax=Sinobacterium caligoides TaxID=933926 RepID=A0A3N2DN05_9GAMM|nr:response regulator transcription factor [Sinobacterium caligoides]ROS01188.1 DNA-binding response OmpR family regulator [Sinobacterium caligoides]